MTNIINNEIFLILILGYYYFDKKNSIKNFTEQLNNYFHKDITQVSVLSVLSNYTIIDPINNSIELSSVNKKYIFIWDKYTNDEKINDLKELYFCFKKGKFINTTKAKNNDIFDSNNIIYCSEYKINDHPEPKPDPKSSKNQKIYQRSIGVVSNALSYANYCCEGECSTELFLRKDGKTNYTEAHHLIPLSFQDEFDYSLDVEANVVSLCPNCHRKLHYGANTYQLLLSLYSQRKKRLSSCKIEISFENLLLLYSIVDSL